ncbi:MAG: hypothetical protein AAFV93_09565 [Chloroflexota bacterium]
MPLAILDESKYSTQDKIRGLRFHIIHQTVIMKRAKRFGFSDIELEAGAERSIAVSACNQLVENGKLR